MQPSAELTSQVLPKASKILNTKGHVVREKSIKIAVERTLRINENIKALPVYINMNNKKQYYVDVDSLTDDNNVN